MGFPAAVTDAGERTRRAAPPERPFTVCFVVMDPESPGGYRIATARAPAESLLRSLMEALRDVLATGAPTSYDVDAPGEVVVTLK